MAKDDKIDLKAAILDALPGTIPDVQKVLKEKGIRVHKHTIGLALESLLRQGRTAWNSRPPYVWRRVGE